MDDGGRHRPHRLSGGGGPVDRLAAWLAPRATTLGVLGAVLLLAGGCWYQALVTPPYRFTDEQAHAGYVLEVQAARLPSIDTPIDGASGGVALRERLAIEPARRHTVWVANDPPVAYVVAAPAAAVTRALGTPGGPLLGLRLANAVAAAVAVVLAFRLARDLAGGDRTVGLVAAGLVAATPHLGFVAALGSTDGFAVMASTGVLAALARVCGAGSGALAERGRGEVRALGLWCAAAAAVRPMALVFAVAAGAIGLGVALVRRRCSPWWALGWLVVPSVVTSGWWYALNVHRYGDPTASDTLFERFGRSPNGSLASTLALRGMWESLLRTLTTRRLEAPLPDDPRSWYQLALLVLVFGAVGTIVLLVRTRRHVGAWAACAALSAIPVLLTAQHRAGGGAPHPRYLLPMVPFAAAMVAFAVVRLLTRWTGLALVLGAATATFLQTRASARWLGANPTGPVGSQLTSPIGPVALRGLGALAAAGGLVLLVAAIAAAPSAVGEGADQPAPVDVPQGGSVHAGADPDGDPPT
ncbi:MAG: glycosyltransferase family 39 protein [Acidimicrobiales bacterium]